MLIALSISNLTVLAANDHQENMSVTSVASVVAKDIGGHWAEKQIKDWNEKGFIKGYSDNTFKPNNTITRAEFITLINNVFGYKDKAELSFTDIKSSDWYFGEIAKAIEAGYVKGYTDGTIKPNNEISRQEVAMVITNIMRLEMAENSVEISKLKDNKAIQAWSKGAIGAVLEKGYMKGYTDQTFKTGNPITRAEATVALNNVAGSIYNKAGAFGDTTIAGNVSVNSDGVTLKNLNIKGDLYLTEGIGNGTVTLDNVTVDGKTLVCGGGMESIIIKNSTLGATVVQKKDGKVRLEASGKTKVGKMQIRSGGKLEEKDLSGVGFEDVEVKKEKSDAIVQFDGDFNNVDILSESKIEVTKGNIAKLQANEGSKDSEIKILAGKIESIEIKVKVKVEVSGGTIAKVTMDKASTGAVLDVKEGATITSLVTEAVIEVLGKGKIEVAEVKINGVKFEVEPVKVVAANDVKVQIGPDPTSAPTTVAVVTPTPTKTTSGGSSGGSSGGGGSTTSKDDVKLEITYSSNESVHVTVYNEDDNVYLENLTIHDFTLKLNRVSVDLDFIGTIINEDENDEVVEYVIKPVEMLEIGKYTLTFSKTGYYSASEQFELDKYSVVFDTNVGETGINRIIFSISPGEKLIDMPDEPTREGYTFIGWALESDATEADFVDAEEINGNVLVYAIWKEVEVFEGRLVELVEIFSYEDDILITLRDLTNPEPETLDEVEAAYIDDLTAEDFILVKGFGTDEAEDIKGIRLFREDGYGTWEYSILPAAGTTFAPGSYRLGFSKEGYDTAHIDVVIVEEETNVEVTGYVAIADIDGGTVAEAVYATAEDVVAVLPNTVTISGTADVVPLLSWADTDNYNAAVAGSYTFTGTIGTLPTGYVDAVDPITTVTVDIVISTVEVSAISVTGDAVVGGTLTAVPDPADATVTYQWMICDTVDGMYTNIAGATSATYTLVADDVGKYIKVTATGTGSYTGTVTSDVAQ